jgi:fucose 4-O-acetylase-like acetyltransferase
MESKLIQNRLNYIDVCKGFGIFSVVFCHIFYRGTLNNIGYLYHMPLFFFISGYLFKIRSDQKKFFVNKFKQFMIPYFIYLLIIYSLQEIFTFKNENLSSKAVLYAIECAGLGGRWLGGFTAVFWFIPCFFMSIVFMNFLLNKFKPKLLPFIVFFCYLLSYINSFWFQSIRFPYDINVVLAIVPFFYVGYVAKSITSNAVLMGAILFGALGVFLIIYGYKNFYDIKSSIYGIPIITFLSSISLILVIVAVSKKIGFFSAVFIELGKASLVIMYLHQPIQILTKMYITDDVYIRILLALGLSYMFYLFAKKYSLTRALFIGSVIDINILVNRRKTLITSST